MRKYLTTLLYCYLGTHVSCVVMAIIMTMIMVGIDPVYSMGPSSFQTLFTWVLIGFILTILPVWIYSMILSACILSIRARKLPSLFSYLVSTGLSSATIFSLRIFSGEPEHLELIPFITVIVASLIGVFLTNTFLNRNDKKRAQPGHRPDGVRQLI